MCIIERVVGCQRNSLQMCIIMAEGNLSFMHSTKTTRRSMVLFQQTLTVVTQFQQDYTYLCDRPDFFADSHVNIQTGAYLPPLHSDSASYIDVLTYSIRRSTDRRFCCYMGLLFACKSVNYPDPFL